MLLAMMPAFVGVGKPLEAVTLCLLLLGVQLGIRTARCPSFLPSRTQQGSAGLVELDAINLGQELMDQLREEEGFLLHHLVDDARAVLFPPRAHHSEKGLG